MDSFIALLRAVNVGGTGKMPMADLRSLAQAAGFVRVRTYIQSGNLVFASDKAPSAVGRLLEDKLENYAKKPVRVILRNAQDLADILEANPFPNADPSKVGVLFLDGPPPSDILQTAKGKTDEQIELGEREVFILYPSGMGRSKLKLAVMSEGTMRNINTVRRLASMAAEA